MNYYLFNKAQDYRRGQLENLTFTKGRLTLEDAEGAKPGRFLSRTFDSWEKETVWHRMAVRALIGANMAVVIRIYATDSEAERLRIESYDQDVERRMEEMEGIRRLTVRNPEDVLLHTVQGRYLWIGAVLWGDGQKGPEISLIQIFFPKESWTCFLPEIYQTEEPGFLERFLAVFQTVYGQVEEKIRYGPGYLDIQAAPPDVLVSLGRWLHVDNIHLWTTSHLRKYLEQGARMYERRGTAAGLERMVEIFIGEKPFIQENGKEGPAHQFRLFLSEKAVPDPKTYQALSRIVREGKPADMEADVIILRPWLVLGQHTYLGINSYLNDYREARLDGQGMMGSTMLGGDRL